MEPVLIVIPSSSMVTECFCFILFFAGYALCQAELPGGFLFVWVKKRRPSEWLGRAVKQYARRRGSLTEVKLDEQSVVTVQIARLKIIEQLTTTVREHDETTARVEVLAVHPEVIREVVDTGADEGDLNFRRARILGVLLVFLDDIRFVDRHDCIWVSLGV